MAEQGPGGTTYSNGARPTLDPGVPAHGQPDGAARSFPMTYNRAATSIAQSTGQVRKAGDHIRLAIAIFKRMTPEEAAARGVGQAWISRLERSVVGLESVEEELRSTGLGS